MTSSHTTSSAALTLTDRDGSRTQAAASSLRIRDGRRLRTLVSRLHTAPDSDSRGPLARVDAGQLSEAVSPGLGTGNALVVTLQMQLGVVAVTGC